MWQAFFRREPAGPSPMLSDAQGPAAFGRRSLDKGARATLGPPGTAVLTGFFGG